MFKLESYITPLIMGYVDKYVKLRQEDFQLSLWGGDAVLNNLDLRLDELEKIVQLPVMFQSGHIHELRLHVPWTKLGSEPVVITINTVECVVKVRDTAYDLSSHSSTTARKQAQQRQKLKRRSQATEELPPGYLQSLVGRIINNVTFIINNLILKFVEDDIVLSVNVKSAECYSVDGEWNRAFVDLTPDDLALRKVVNFADLTVCLDKTNSSGHIECYQEPMAYRCAVTCRLHMEYDSVTAKFPRVTRFNLYCDTLNLSVTDTQLPMFVRLVELCLAMYYGALDIPTRDPDGTQVDPVTPSESVIEPRTQDLDIPVLEESEEYQGWASWAWSYVPQILPTEEEEEGEGGMEGGRQRSKPPPHILSIGFYIHRGNIVFKLTEKSRDGSDLPHKKIHFHPFLNLNGEGVAIEVVMQGQGFFDVQCGITSLSLTPCGSCICGLSDTHSETYELLSAGEQLDQKAGLNYLTNSLFDDMSWENRGERSQHIVNGDEHRRVYTEQNAIQKFGAFWVDSMYTYEKPDRIGVGSQSSDTEHSDVIFQREFSILRFVIGNLHVNFSSSLYHRLSKMWYCATDHQYPPYGDKDKKSSPTSLEDRPKPREEQVRSLEEFIPTHVMHLTLMTPSVTLWYPQHPECDVKRRNYKSRHRKRDTKTNTGDPQSHPLPAVILSASRFDLQITRPMYPGRLVKLVTAIAGPSSNLLHHCHSHTQIKLFGLQGGLQKISPDDTRSRPLTLLPPCSFALYQRKLLLPKLWTNSSLPLREWMYEIPTASVNVNKASVLLTSRVISSWMTSVPPAGCLDDSLLDDLFPVTGESTYTNHPMLELGLYGLEFKSCESTLVNAWTASLSSIHILLYTPGVAGKMSAVPILYGPNDTSKATEADFFQEQSFVKSDVRTDCLTVTVQIPKHTSISEAQALALVDLQGLCVWFDPALMSWFHYIPQPRLPHHKQEVTLDLSLAQMTSPLNAMSTTSVHSTSSPSHKGLLSKPTLSSQPGQGGDHSSQDEKQKDRGGNDEERDPFAEWLASHFPLIRLLHVQLDLKPWMIFLPKASLVTTESSSDILSLVHSARQEGRLADTLVITTPGIVVMSTMSKSMNVAQELPITVIQGSLIGEKLPWTIKLTNGCVFSLLSDHPKPVFLLHPLDVTSTLAVTCTYNPPTSEVISTLALCLHVDVGQPMVELTAYQLHLCSVVCGMCVSIANNTAELAAQIVKLFAHPKVKDAGVKVRGEGSGQHKSDSSIHKRESSPPTEVLENVTTDISEDMSCEASPLHESIFSHTEDNGVRLSIWLQLMVPHFETVVYHIQTNGQTNGGQTESAISVVLDHLDLSVDSQRVYSKAKLTLGALSVRQADKSSDNTFPWSHPDAIVVSCSRQLPRNLHMVSNKLWLSESSTAVSFAQPHDVLSKEKKHGVISLTFTRALCKNVKKRLRKANVELPSVNELCVDSSNHVSPDGAESGLDEIYFHKYLSEICLKTEPFDVVIKPKLLEVLSGITNSSSGKCSEQKGMETPELKVGPERLTVPGRKGNSQAVRKESNVFESVSVHNLPLIYGDVGVFRVFVPMGNNKSEAKDSSCGPDSADGSKPPTATLSSDNDHTDQWSTLSHDLLVIQMNSCLIQPHAENPLPRVAQDKTIFQRALQAGLSQHPGSSIEDRQYQIDIKGLSMSTGVWSRVLQNVRPGDLHRSPTGSTYQIPALDWNNFLMDSPSQDKKDVVCLVPLATAFDLCLVLAPPITYVPRAGGKDISQSKLICGLTTELNLTSDLDLFFSTSQLHMLTSLTSDFIEVMTSDTKHPVPFNPPMSPIPSAHPRPQMRQTPQSKGIKSHSLLEYPAVTPLAGDSGVESDFSTRTQDRFPIPHSTPLHQSSKQARFYTPGETRNKNEMKKGHPASLSQLPPLDILVTAGRISCTVYTHKVLQEDVTLEMPLFLERGSSVNAEQTTSGPDSSLVVADNLTQALQCKRPPSKGGMEGREEENDEEDIENEESFTTFNFMKQSSPDVLKKTLPKGCTCIVPFVYIYVAQPHMLAANHSQDNIKLEVSCYDVLVKGASDKHLCAVDELHVIPDCADFNIHWVATRAGQPHPYTGIPPSLFTARFLRELNQTDTLSLQIERPVKVKASQLAVEQIVAFSHEMGGSSESENRTKPASAQSELSGEGGEGATRSTKKKSALQKILDKPWALPFTGKLSVHSSQVLVVMETSDAVSHVGVLMSVDGTNLEIDLADSLTSTTQTLNGHLEIKDAIVKTCYDKQWRSLIGPLSTRLEACLTWIQVATLTPLPQLLLGVEMSHVIVKVGQEHVFCFTELAKRLQAMCNTLFTPASQTKVNTEQSSKSKAREHQARPASAQSKQAAQQFVADRTHDDIRAGGFTYSPESGSVVQPEPYEIVFTTGKKPVSMKHQFDNNDSSHLDHDDDDVSIGNIDNHYSSMCWCYPHPRVITRLELMPVPFSLNSSNWSLDSGMSKTATVPCVLQYWDDSRSEFRDFAEFRLCESEPVTVTMPDPRPTSSLQLVAARMWRVMLLEEEGEHSVSVMPTSLAACMCVDSAFIPSLLPSASLSLSLMGAELQVAHHLNYNGKDIPRQLSRYSVSPTVVDEQVFGVVVLEQLNLIASHLDGKDPKTSIKASTQIRMEVLEYGHLRMEQVVPTFELDACLDLCSGSKDINGYVKADQVKVRVGKSIVHTLNMATAAWTHFSPSHEGPYLIFNHFIICNNTMSTIRFGQAGTDENIVLHSGQMVSYSWRSFAAEQLLHLCMDQPTWRWTQPFPIDGEGGLVRHVSAKDQSYIVIVKTKKLTGLQMQVTLCGQAVVYNALSQPISIKLSGLSANGKDPQHPNAVQTLTIQPGASLPSILTLDVLDKPVNFRLAGHNTPWSHDIYLRGDCMKENQMVKTCLPDGSYFHIWCRLFCQHFHGAVQKLLMLSPLYVVQSHLPRPLYLHVDSPKTKQSQQILIGSRGREFQLHCQGGDVSHQMAFRLRHDMAPSSPPVVLSTGLIHQLERKTMKSVDVDNIITQKRDTAHLEWPYVLEAVSGDLTIDTNCQQIIPSPSQHGDLGAESDLDYDLDPQPSIDLNVRLSEYMPGCDTLLVEVSPPYLVHNATSCDLVIWGVRDNQLTLTSGQTLAPPLEKDSFKLSIKHHNTILPCKVIPMSEDSMDYVQYNDKIGKLLFMDGYVHVTYKLPAQKDKLPQLVFITVTSDIHHGIRVICLRERFSLSNQTSFNLTSKLIALPLGSQPIKMADTEGLTVTCSGKGQSQDSSKEGLNIKEESGVKDEVLPLFNWTTVKGEGVASVVDKAEDELDPVYVCYMAFRCSESSSDRTNSWQWSVPIRVISTKDGTRSMTSVPQLDQSHDVDPSATPLTWPMCVTTQQVKGVTHIVLCKDSAPVCVVENLCPFDVQFGQTSEWARGPEQVIQEQQELVSDLPWVPPGGVAHYTPPSINTNFVSTETVKIPKLAFRALITDSESGTTKVPSEWSPLIQITGNTDGFARLPGVCDLKVLIEPVGAITHLVLRPVSKAEVTAKEIRSRLTASQIVTTVTAASSDKKEMDKSGIEEKASKRFATSDLVRYSEKMKSKSRSQGSGFKVTLGAVCSTLTLTLQDESHPQRLSELFCLHFKDFLICSFPVVLGLESLTSERSYSVCCTGIQLDNQQYGVRMYDFPVVLLPQKTEKDRSSSSSAPSSLSTFSSFIQSCMEEGMSIVELHAALRSKSFLHLQVVTLSDPIWKTTCVESVDVSLQPVSLYIDDTFIYRIVEELEGFIPSKLAIPAKLLSPSDGTLKRRLPAVVKLNSYTLSQPIRIKHFTIQPISMLLSVHASVKIFLASDHTPLNLSRYQRTQVCSTTQRLVHALIMHYASAAVFRAGIVVGSLEILGNPTGLVRSIGSGVSDLVTLPYVGLTRGPGAFVGGLTRGMGSLVRNVSAGMITSVTNFASSVSRNMDRLSLDSTHVERQEENRRRRPVGVSDGLKQGLTGFGLSLLGAVAGLADQPIQTLIASSSGTLTSREERATSPSSTASGLVTGMGKGLVGVLTKPIGGAAEFVSQAGQGILHGTGLGQLPSHIEKYETRKRSELHNSLYKYTCKIFSSLPTTDLLLAVPAVTPDLTESEVKVTLLLTSEVLVVMNEEEDAPQHTLALTELEYSEGLSGSGKVVLHWLDQFYHSSQIEQNAKASKERVAAFIDSTQNLATSPRSHLDPSHDLSSLQPGDPDLSASLDEDLQSQGQIEPGSKHESLTEEPKLAPGSEPTTPNVTHANVTSPQFEFHMLPHLEHLFVTCLRLAKNRLQGKGFTV